MSYAERREAILEVLCIRRHDTYRNLAFEFQVLAENTVNRGEVIPGKLRA